MTILLLLLFSISCFALTPPEVVLVLNDNSTRDTDANGVYDYEQIRLAYKVAHPDWDTSQVVRLQTYDTDGVIPWDYMDIEIDTSGSYGTAAGVTKNGAHDYILDAICAAFDANGWWGQKKCAILVMGMPLRTSHNATYPESCASGLYGIIWSIDDIIRVFAQPSLSWNSAWQVDGGWRNSFPIDYELSGYRAFVPGLLWNRSYDDTNDSLRQWLLVSRLDGLNVTDVLDQITRSAAGTQFDWQGGTTWTTDAWAVIDQDTLGDVDPPYTMPWSNTTEGEWGNPNRFRADVTAAFGANILWDSTRGALGAIPDSIPTHFGLSTGQNPSGGALLYFNSNRHANPILGTDHYWNLDFEIADGASVFDIGSYNCASIHDTSGRLNNQPLICEAIATGFTYAAGNVCEPSTVFYVSPRYAGQAYVNGYTSCAQIGQLCAKGLKLCVVLGDPLGNMGRSTVTTVSGQTIGGGGWSSWR